MPRPHHTMRLRRIIALVVAALLVAGLINPAHPSAAAPLMTIANEAADSAPATLADYWDGTAEWTYVRSWTQNNTASQLEPHPDHGTVGWGGWASASNQIVIVGTNWYMFHARTMRDTSGNKIECPTSPAPNGARAYQEQLVVRVSTNQGVTWSSPPTPVISPGDHDAWDCMALDGEVYYDTSVSPARWRYLFQCSPGFDTAAGKENYFLWNGCYAERRNSNPMGSFSPADDNPVINTGELWNQICDSGDDCYTLAPHGNYSPYGNYASANTVGHEGTFDIIEQRDGAWWIGFHGYDGHIPGSSGTKGYRGIAKTSTFSSTSWVVDNSGAGVPTDSILDANDISTSTSSADYWRETWDGNPKGAGHSSIMYESGHYYQIAEMFDIDLGCTPGQRWNLGMFRSTTLNNTNWDQYPRGNPIIYSSTNTTWTATDPDTSWPCSVTYPRLFKDPNDNTIYLSHGRSMGSGHWGVHLYKLELSNNLLTNGDFWRADTHTWHKKAGTSSNFLTYRSPHQAADSTVFAAVNCNGSCADGDEIYQDVDVSLVAGRDALFSLGHVLDSSSGSAQLQIKLTQYAQDRTTVVQSYVYTATVGATWSTSNILTTINANAKIARFSIKPLNASYTYHIDNAHLDIEDTRTADDLAQGAKVTSSGVLSGPDYATIFSAEKAVDADANTRWAANNGANWLQIDLGTPRVINKFRTTWETAGAYTIATSTDGSTFTTQVSTSASNDSTSTDTLANPVTARYVKISASAYRSIYTFSIFAPVSTFINLAQNFSAVDGTHTSGYWGAGFEGTKAFDTNSTTRWASNASNVWILVDLGSNQSVNRVRTKWETAGAYTIQVAPSGGSYTTVYSGNAPTDGTTEDVFATHTARYVRINASTYRSIYSMTVFGP